MTTETDSHTDVDVDVDAVIPCCTPDCQTPAAWRAIILHEPKGDACISLPICAGHLEQLKISWGRLYILAAATGMLPACNLHRSPGFLKWERL